MEKKFTNVLRIKIGGLIVEILSDDCVLNVESNKFLKQFRVSDGKTDILFCVHFEQIPTFNSARKILELNDKLYTRSLLGVKDNLILQSTSSLYPFQYCVVMNIDQKSCHFYFPNKKLIDENGLSFFADQFRVVYMLMFYFLSSFNGLFLHASAINYNGYGLIFAGKSGSGKSTLAKLWKNNENSFILCDDMVIIRRIKNKFKVYSTPWNRNVDECSPQDVPLNNIFFIKHARTNIATPLSHIDVITSLLNSSWFNFWSLNSMQRTFNLLEQLIREIPCYELGFVPNESVLNFVRSIK